MRFVTVFVRLYRTTVIDFRFGEVLTLVFAVTSTYIARFSLRKGGGRIENKSDNYYYTILFHCQFSF